MVISDDVVSADGACNSNALSSYKTVFLYDVVLNFFQVGIVRELRREILDLLRRQGNKGEVPRKSWGIRL